MPMFGGICLNQCSLAIRIALVSNQSVFFVVELYADGGENKQLIRWWIVSFRESLCTDARGRGLVVTCNGYGKEKLQRLLQLLWLL